ncbi:MAG: hypothetical protein H8D67_31790 [Deltaproteobacteria bacterium]|nr:hypothetical protein [Deltaproteobacteria bacterium]
MENIIKMIQSDTEWNEMGRAGKSKVEREFNILTETAKLEAIYQKALKNSPASEITDDYHLDDRKQSPSIISDKKLNIVVDASPLEDLSLRVRGIGRYMFNHFKELIAQTPDWRYTICGIAHQLNIPELNELLKLSNCVYKNWKEFPGLKSNLLYLPHPMDPFTLDIIKYTSPFKVPMVCTFHDLIPLLFTDMYLNSNPSFKKLYYKQLAAPKVFCYFFLCDSRCTANDLENFADIPIERLKVIYAGVFDIFTNCPSE